MQTGRKVNRLSVQSFSSERTFGHTEDHAWLGLTFKGTNRNGGNRLDLPLQSSLIILVSNLILVFQQPVNGRFIVHRFVYRLGHRLAVDFK